jgi:hypothetical protein
MADDRSVVALDVYHKAAQQFDYAVTGATGAICTYILQTFKPKRVDVSPHSLELVALLVLVLSLFIGFKLLESKIVVHQANAAWLGHNERLGALVKALPDLAFGPAVNIRSGEVSDAQSVATEIPVLQDRIHSSKANLDKWAGRCLRLYRWRNRSLGTGFLLLVFARLSAPYW